MTRAADLAALQLIAGAKHALVQARMAALQRREAEIRDHMEALAQDRTARAAAIAKGATQGATQGATEAAPEDAAMQAGQDLRWHGWIDGRKARLNGDLAGLAQTKERLRAELARQFGRKDVVDTLVRQDRARRQAERDARAERDPG